MNRYSAIAAGIALMLAATWAGCWAFDAYRGTWVANASQVSAAIVGMLGLFLTVGGFIRVVEKSY